MTVVTVYTTDPCSFCTRTKGILASHGVEFEEVNLTRDPDGRMELVQKTGMMTFPQIVANGRLIGGYRELQEAVDDGRLDDLLAA
jgi:glutaredoxin 3